MLACSSVSSIGGKENRCVMPNLLHRMNKFTGKERDAETGLDYFGARYMSAAQGRFTYADDPFVGQSPLNPQSWNLYTYGFNNPLRFLDPTGKFSVASDGYTDEGSGLFAGACSAGTIGDQSAGNNSTNAANIDVRNTGYGVEVSMNGQPAYESPLQNDYTSELLFFGLFGGGRGAGAAGGAGLAETSIGHVLPPTVRGGVIERMLRLKPTKDIPSDR